MTPGGAAEFVPAALRGNRGLIPWLGVDEAGAAGSRRGGRPVLIARPAFLQRMMRV